MNGSWEDDYEVPDHIDLSERKWVKNPFVQEFSEMNLVSLDDDVKKVFSDSKAVNDALRKIIAEKKVDLPKAS